MIAAQERDARTAVAMIADDTKGSDELRTEPMVRLPPLCASWPIPYMPSVPGASVTGPGGLHWAKF